jgi:hypothetical protein
MRHSRRKPRPDEALARLSAKRYGLVTRAEALAAGLSREQIARRLRNGELIRVYRDVYRVAAVPSSWHQSALAPCLRLPGFVWVCGASAGRFWALDGCEGNEIEVLTTCKLRRIDDVTIHQVAGIAPRDVTVVRHIPVTTVHRTICDLGMAAAPNVVELALESALRRGLRPSTACGGRSRNSVQRDGGGLPCLRRFFANMGLAPPKVLWKPSAHSSFDALGCRAPPDSTAYEMKTGSWPESISFGNHNE